MDTAHNKSSSAEETGRVSSSTPNLTSLQNDELIGLFTTGSFYDCSFKVSNDVTGESKLFRCHKVFLASCSEVFEKMLFGTFKEATVDRDYEIILSKTSPDVFHLAMRFVYGRSTVFKTPEMAAQVYLFGREWMIPKLIKAVGDFLEMVTICPEDALKILPHFVAEENNISLKCLDVIKSSIKEVMATKSWFEAPEEVVLKILQIDTMEISEPLLFENLVKWGRAQVEDEADVRAKIDKCLKLVRFCSMSCAEFSNLCFKPNPLTTEEKFKIFLSITQNNTTLLPKKFSNSKKPRLRRTVVQWSKVNFLKCDVDRRTEPSVLTLIVEPLHYLLGVFLYSLTGINAGELVYLICDVYSSEDPNLCIVSANFRGIVQANGNGELLFDQPVLMKKGFSYKFEVTYKHSTKIQTAAFQKEASGPWVWKVQAVSVIVNPNKALPVDPPIVDISGLILAKNI